MVWFIDRRWKKKYLKGIAEFIKGVGNNKEDVDEDESRVKDFLKKHDKDNKGYVSEEEFIGFYKEALKDKKHVVWKNLKMMDIREDLTKKDEPFDIKYFENEKLPRYQLGNDIEFIKSIIKQYYKNPKTNYILIEFLMFLTTNEMIYNEVLNMFNSEGEDKNSFINKILETENKYIELNYIFIIIESILQDLEINLYLNNSSNKNEIDFEDKEYSLQIVDLSLGHVFMNDVPNRNLLLKGSPKRMAEIELFLDISSDHGDF